MSEKRFNLFHTFDHEPKRDAYGFALRPQHAQRYREYAGIYKEEEDERVERWKIFLEHQKELAQPIFSEDKEILQEAIEFKKETVPEKSSECDKGEATKLKETTGSGGDCEEKGSGATVSDTGSQGKAEDITNLKEETVSERSKESNKSEGTKETVLEGDKEGEKVEATEVKQGSVSERAEEGDDSSKRSGSDVSAELDPKKEQLPKETESRKVQTSWSQIRESLKAIEDMMSSRVKKRKDMKGEQITKSGDHLQSINEAGSLEGESLENIKGKDETSAEGPNDFCEISSPNDGVPPKPYVPWKEELECLVRGGVPKELRGEVWQAFVGVKARREGSYYQDLLAQETNAGENEELASTALKKWKKQIEKDIPRTFPGHPALNQDGRDSLRRLLVAYARHNPSVGYCQAMNFFAGILLLLMPEENAFWTFVGIIDDYFEGYYTEEMIESQVDQLVFEELIRERFPKLVNHLDYLGVQVAWISGPWFLSIFVNMLPWESVLRVWDVLLYEGNRVMLFRTALALMELYGPALVTTKDAGDAITLLQSLTGSTFDSSQLVFTACMGYLAVTEAKLRELREKHRPAVLEVVEERLKKGRVWKDSKGLATKLYSFKHDPAMPVEEKKKTEGSGDLDAAGNLSQVEPPSSKLDGILGGSEVNSLPDLEQQVVWMKVELCNLLEEKRSAILRAEELETALVEMVKQDNRRQLSARIEELEQEVAELRQALSDKKEQEHAMLQVLMRVEQEQRVTEDARRSAEQDAAAQRYAVHVLEEKYEKAMASIAQMEKRVVMAESMLEATLQYQSGKAKAISSPQSVPNQGPAVESPKRRIGLFGLGWRDRNKDKPTNLESSDSKSTNE